MNVLHEGVELAFGVALIFVSLPTDSNSDPVGKVSDTFSPNELVELGIDSHVLSFHHLGDQFLDGSDGTGSFVLEGFTMSQFVNIEGGVDGSFGKTGSLFFLDHNLRL